MGFQLPLYIKQPILREYITSDTWIKPANLKQLIVVCIGAGGGGGGGSVGATTVTNNGGRGGGGGFVSIRRMLAVELTQASYSITIGTGGAGGAGRVSTAGDGLNGSIGGSTRFHTGATNLVLAIGGWGGSRGRTNNNTPAYSSSGTVQNCIPRLGINIQQALVPTGVFSSFPVSIDALDASGGATGGNANGRPSGDNTSRVGRDGGGVYNGATLIAGPGGVTGAKARNGVDDLATRLILESTIFGTYGVGSGGAGGRTDSQTTNGQMGGDGGRCSGGGGGGAACTGFNGGDGGVGGNGYCVLLEIY